MNPRERLLGALRGDPIDRVPLVLEGFHCSSPESVTDPAKLEIVDRVAEHLHLFTPSPLYVNRYLVTPKHRMRESTREQQDGNIITTTEIDTPRGPLTAITGRNAATDTAWTIKYPVESLEDTERIRSVPWEIPPDLSPPESTSSSDTFFTRGIVLARVSTPFVCVAGMMPYQMFLELCVTRFGLIRDLTQQCLDRILDMLDVVLAENTIEYVGVYGCEWLTPPMGSPRLYEGLVQHFEKQVIGRIHAAGALAHVHCHGNVRSTLERVIERGGDFLEPMEPPPDGDITLAEAKVIANGRITFGGNIESRIMEAGDEDDAERATRAAFEGGKSRMVLQTTSGPISTMTPRLTRNYHRLIDVWEELSPII